MLSQEKKKTLLNQLKFLHFTEPTRYMEKTKQKLRVWCHTHPNVWIYFTFWVSHLLLICMILHSRRWLIKALDYYSLYSNSSPAAYFYKHSPLYRQQNLKPEVSIAIGCEVCHDKSESNSQILFPGLVETLSTVRRACRTLLLPVDILITLSHLFSQTPRQLHCGG